MRKSSKIRNKFDAVDLQSILGLTYISVCRILRDGTIKGEKIGQKWYVDKRVLNNYLNKGNIFDKPEKIVLDVINQAIAEAMAENIEKLELAVKQKIIAELEGNIEKNLVKIGRNNIKLTEFISGEVTKQLEGKAEGIRKEFEEAKQL
ncbi:hypothetical protein ES695_11150 [Candidatus Atribacteria bacterium 1244-E10-H5-B2]|nr:MAG: hypothetical protein ES695_11150 [Candidatus Atribacteria bacterium 1244-E10-H5-B2]